jgi:hypothetical protein
MDLPIVYNQSSIVRTEERYRPPRPTGRPIQRIKVFSYQIKIF